MSKQSSVQVKITNPILNGFLVKNRIKGKFVKTVKEHGLSEIKSDPKRLNRAVNEREDPINASIDWWKSGEREFWMRMDDEYYRYSQQYTNKF